MEVNREHRSASDFQPDRATWQTGLNRHAATRYLEMCCAATSPFRRARDPTGIVVGQTCPAEIQTRIVAIQVRRAEVQARSFAVPARLAAIRGRVATIPACVPTIPVGRATVHVYSATVPSHAERNPANKAKSCHWFGVVQEVEPGHPARWLCTIKQSNGRIEHFKFTLYSDFSVNRFADDNGKHPKSWEFKKDKIVITNVTASSPKGGFKDTCTIHPDGQKFDAKNQLGAVFTGKRID